MSEGVPDGIVKVSFHIFEHQVEVFIIFGTDHLLQTNNGAVLQFIQEGDLAEGTLSISGVLKCIENLFEGEGVAGFAVGDLPDMAVSSTAHFLEQAILLKDVGFYFF